jgi:hypothetical protein
MFLGLWTGSKNFTSWVVKAEGVKVLGAMQTWLFRRSSKLVASMMHLLVITDLNEEDIP